MKEHLTLLLLHIDIFSTHSLLLHVLSNNERIPSKKKAYRNAANIQ
jgi:hypothetical protein